MPNMRSRSVHHNAHWRPQSRFCGMRTYLDRFNFVGNFESLQPHAEVFLKGTDIWDPFGEWGWGDHNGSMFSRNTAAHRTSDGAVTSKNVGGGRFGRLVIDEKKASMSYDELLPPGSKLRKAAFNYYKEDFEMFARITTPPFDNSRYIKDLAEMHSLGIRGDKR